MNIFTWIFLQWLLCLTRYLKQKSEGSGPTTQITGDEVAKIIIALPYEPYETVGFDHIQTKLLDLQPHQQNTSELNSAATELCRHV